MEILKKYFSELTAEELYEILKTRQEIFVVEQDCPYMDIDDLDKDALHLFTEREDGRVTSCLRVFRDKEQKDTVHIGRVVTLEHGKGLGGEILHAGVAAASEDFGARRITLEAQTYAVGYYAKEGFKVVSDVFDLDGIDHVRMELIL